MGVAFVLIGLLAILAGIVMFIIALIRKRGWGVIRSLVIGGVGFVLVIVGAVVGVTQETTKPNPTTIPTPAPAPSVIEVTAQELWADYKANQVAADLKYKDQTLKVTGTVIEIGKGFLDTPYVKLLGGSTYIESLMGVQCMFDRKYEPELAQLTKGQKESAEKVFSFPNFLLS